MSETTTTTSIPGYKAGTWTIDPTHSEPTSLWVGSIVQVPAL